MKEIWKVVRKLSREQKSAAAGGRGGVRTGAEKAGIPRWLNEVRHFITGVEQPGLYRLRLWFAIYSTLIYDEN